MAVKKGKEEAKKNESKAKSKVKEEVVETQVEEVEEDTPKKMPKRPKGYTKFQWTASRNPFVNQVSFFMNDQFVRDSLVGFLSQSLRKSGQFLFFLRLLG